MSDVRRDVIALLQLVGGPSDGKLGLTSVQRPGWIIFLLQDPRTPTLRDRPQGVARWDEKAEVYEVESLHVQESLSG